MQLSRILGPIFHINPEQRAQQITGIELSFEKWSLGHNLDGFGHQVLETNLLADEQLKIAGT
jgi:hypothetical protein